MTEGGTNLKCACDCPEEPQGKMFTRSESENQASSKDYMSIPKIPVLRQGSSSSEISAHEDDTILPVSIYTGL